MKVIKHGKYHFDKLRLKCNCGCEFEITMEDNYYITMYSAKAQGISMGYIISRCPECNDQVQSKMMG